MVVDTAERWRVCAQVAAVLGRARRLLGTPVPDDLARSLRIRPGMRTALALVDECGPIASLRRDESWVRMFTKAATPSLMTTMGNILGKAAPAIRSRWESANAATARTSADAAVLDAFFSRVEATTAGVRQASPTARLTLPARPGAKGGPHGRTARYTGT